MAEYDPELKEILEQKASRLKTEANFFKNVDQNGINDVTDGTIDNIIRSSPIPVIVYFSADAWCKPCKVMGPVFDELSKDFTNKVLFLKINTDHNPRASTYYRIGSVPTFMMFNGGNRIVQRIGAIPRIKFKAWIEEVLQKLQ
ncbi:MAG: thioredoxin family protein [Candidatus Hodarchaeales archaeon]|jgi:thioredoxin 1